MKRFNVLTLALLITCFATAQTPIEAGGFIGLANYRGDIGFSSDEFGELNYALSALVKYPYKTKLHLRAQLSYAFLSADDQNSVEPGVRNRNWRFSANLYEVGFMAEFLPFAKPRFNQEGSFRRQFNPYIYAGIAGVLVKDDLDVSQSGILLRNLRTVFPEPDDRSSFLAFPIGGGLRFDFNQRMTLSGDFGWRFTTSDYIDGVSVNASSEPDWYFFLGTTFTSYLGN